MSQPEDRITYNFEHDRKVRACFIGAGDHAFRNIYPTFRYAPVELVAICDLNLERACAFARQFGALRAYDDFREMLAEERPEAVFIVTGYDAEGRVQATDIAREALAAGAHVWMEKPTAATLEEVEDLMEVSRSTGHFVMTGLKKVFFPTVEKAKEIISSPSFGRPTSIYVRYPQHLPPFEERDDRGKMLSFLDHIYHPAAILQYLMGPIARLTYEWEPGMGASVAALRFASGAVGALHLASGLSAASPLERLEVVGKGANLIIENGVRLQYYRRSKSSPYGRRGSFLTDEETAPLFWEPEFSLGQLYNNNLFTLGYAQEVQHFCDCVLTETPPRRGTLEAVAEIMRLFDAYRTVDAGVTTAVT